MWLRLMWSLIMWCSLQEGPQETFQLLLQTMRDMLSHHLTIIAGKLVSTLCLVSCSVSIMKCLCVCVLCLSPCLVMYLFVQYCVCIYVIVSMLMSVCLYVTMCLLEVSTLYLYTKCMDIVIISIIVTYRRLQWSQNSSPELTISISEYEPPSCIFVCQCVYWLNLSSVVALLQHTSRCFCCWCILKTGIVILMHSTFQLVWSSEIPEP